MPTPYNRDYTRRKSTVLFDTDCRNIGPIRTVGAIGETVTLFGIVTLDEAVEAGECISMVRVPPGFMVTGVTVAWEGDEGVAPAGDAVVAFGDPYACGRLCNGPLDFRARSGAGSNNLGSFASCGVLTKIGRVGDGCGLGYTYTCETDLIITNLYGLGGAYQGGFPNTQVSGGGVWGGAITSGTTIAVEVRGVLTGNV